MVSNLNLVYLNGFKHGEDLNIKNKQKENKNNNLKITLA
jgi:hypothetical protein